ncbi:GTP cyclohydrolase II [bacterium]|nr:GTP cyclohydrolase II [bacterium]
MVANLQVRQVVTARLPVEAGDFRMLAFHNGDGKDHLALVLGEVDGQEEVLVRVHSECLTGDVFGSRRCDCGPQLNEALRLIGAAGKGVLVYLRQEGRGIGLIEKMRAYNLQDCGYDTLDANLALGHPADAREYFTAAQMLARLGVRSVRLLTNNPEKVEGLGRWGIPVVSRQPIQVNSHPDNARYLVTKTQRMGHVLDLDRIHQDLAASRQTCSELEGWLQAQTIPELRPLVTLTYAQSLDGSIAQIAGQPFPISCQESAVLTHRLRRSHQAILVGVGTVVADDPQLNVRFVDGPSPTPIVLDPHLRIPDQARILHSGRRPIIICGPEADGARKLQLSQQGARLLQARTGRGGEFDLAEVLGALRKLGVERLMVEGGSRVLHSFLRQKAADLAVVTVSPRWLGGLSATGERDQGITFPSLTQPRWQTVGSDAVMWSRIEWPEVQRTQAVTRSAGRR